VDDVVKYYHQSLQEKFPGEIVGPSQIAEVYHKKLRTVYNEVQSGKFEPRPFRVNNRPRWKLLDVARHLASLGVE
jgi:hypothetical protein